MTLTHQALTLTLADPFVTAHSASRTRHNRLVCITTDKGALAHGEVAPYYGQSPQAITAALDQAAAALAREPTRLSPTALTGPAAVQAVLASLGDLPTAVAAGVGMALADLAAHQAGQSVAAWLGDPAPQVSRTISTSLTLGQADTPTMIRKAHAAAGWPILKIKVGTPHDADNLAAIAAIHPTAELRLDANGAWGDNPRLALDCLRALGPFGPRIIEQPLAVSAPPAAWAELRAGLISTFGDSRPRLFADESLRTPADVAALAPALDGAVVKLAKSGGYTSVLNMIAAARQANLTIMIGCMVESSLGIAAAAALVWACDLADLDGHLLLETDPFEGLTLTDQRQLCRPTAPGLGVRPRPISPTTTA